VSSVISNARGKIREVEDLAAIIGQAKVAGQKIVHCHGVFDLLHVGHIRHFEQAKQMGDMLVVTTTADRFVNKGPGRPVFSDELRAEAIAALDCVDYVAISGWPMAVEVVKLIQPDFYVKGPDYADPDNDMSGGIILEEEAVRSVGGQIAFTDDITFSASNLINRHLPVFPPEVKEYLEGFSGRYSSDDILRYLENAKTLKVLVIGETIIDEYVYCETLGKTGKDPVLATRQLHSEKFAGGIIPVANNVAAFCQSVGLVSILGGEDTQEQFVRSRLDAEVDPTFLYMDGKAPTIVKRRFVESYPFQKLFEIYIMEDSEGSESQSKALCDKLEELLPQYDVALVLDYGHGMLSPEAVEILTKKAKFLAINTQANAGNRGFNTVSKYPRADFICVSENEIRLDARSRRSDLREIVSQISAKLGCKHVLVTRGVGGCLAYSKDDGFFEIPALTAQVVDRMGAGDAVFSLASLYVAQGAPIEMVGFLGNAVGAEAVSVVGHRSSIQKLPLFRHVETLLK
jgi:rfaE bifunctional protein kinase chain/domain/rfaE bifunctional protein nucleotidyltransferase chain/domain